MVESQKTSPSPVHHQALHWSKAQVHTLWLMLTASSKYLNWLESNRPKFSIRADIFKTKRIITIQLAFQHAGENLSSASWMSFPLHGYIHNQGSRKAGDHRCHHNLWFKSWLCVTRASHFIFGVFISFRDNNTNTSSQGLTGDFKFKRWSSWIHKVVVRV